MKGFESNQAGQPDIEDRIRAEMSLTGPVEAPPEKAIGSWRCRCGAVSVGNIESSVGISFIASCPSCGDRVEIMSMPSLGEGQDQGGPESAG